MFNIAFVAAVVWKLAPIFLRTAKKWRNKSVGFVLIGLAIASVGFHSVLQNHGTEDFRLKFLIEGILLLSTLMFYMGGRIIAPSLAGHFQRRDINLKDRVQPKIEGTILILLFSALVLNLTVFEWAPMLVGRLRSEERRVGKECRSGLWPCYSKKDCESAVRS